MNDKIQMWVGLGVMVALTGAVVYLAYREDQKAQLLQKALKVWEGMKEVKPSSPAEIRIVKDADVNKAAPDGRG
jgi:hypothetical protein